MVIDTLAPEPRSGAQRIYRLLWRWHFYAGLFCIPFILVLAVSGTLYLFKPQVERWQDRAFDTVVFTGQRLGVAREVGLALQQHPAARFAQYEVAPIKAGAGRVWLRDAGGAKLRVVIHPIDGHVIDESTESQRLMQVIKTLHGELLLGDGGSLVVELAACWAVVLVSSGLYLWWPRNTGAMAGVLYPRLRQGRGILWRDLHAVTGMWVSVLALTLLLTALPWTGFWGKAFKQVRQWSQVALVQQDWTQSRSEERAEHVEHAGTHLAAEAAVASAFTMDHAVIYAQSLDWARPVLVAQKNGNWVISSEAQNRPLRQSVMLDGQTGRVVEREQFADKLLTDRIVGIGVAAHEGQLFGWLNQLLGVVTTLGLVTVAVSGFAGWWRRRPTGRLGAPPPVPKTLGMGFALMIMFFALLLPLLGCSLVLIAFVDRVVLRSAGSLRHWLGLTPI